MLQYKLHQNKDRKKGLSVKDWNEVWCFDADSVKTNAMYGLVPEGMYGKMMNKRIIIYYRSRHIHSRKN